MDQRQFDNELKILFQKNGEKMEPSQALYDNILQGIKHEEEKNMKNLFRTKKMKGFVIAAAVCVVSISCYAAGKVYSMSSSSNKDFDEPPTVSQMEKAVDFSSKYVEKFDNGFVFENGGSGNVEAQDENGAELVQFKQLNFMYRNAEIPDAYVALNTKELAAIGPVERVSGEELNLGDITGQYTESQYKFYPPNAEVSAEDLKLQEEGKLQISYGSDKIEEAFFQTLEWEQDSIIYELTLSNVNADKAELADMAKKIITMK